MEAMACGIAIGVGVPLVVLTILLVPAWFGWRASSLMAGLPQEIRTRQGLGSETESSGAMSSMVGMALLLLVFAPVERLEVLQRWLLVIFVALWAFYGAIKALHLARFSRKMEGVSEALGRYSAVAAICLAFASIGGVLLAYWMLAGVMR